MSTTEVYSDPVFEGNSGNGQMASSNMTYDIARAGPAVLTKNENLVGQRKIVVGGEDTWYFCYESFNEFPTDEIADTELIVSATLQMYGWFDWSDTDFLLEARWLEDGYIGGSGDLDADDWVPGDELAGLELLASLTTVGFTTSGYNIFVSKPALTAAIDFEAPTYIIVDSYEHNIGSAPVGGALVQEYVIFKQSDGGETTDPKLVIIHQDQWQGNMNLGIHF